MWIRFFITLILLLLASCNFALEKKMTVISTDPKQNIKWVKKDNIYYLQINKAE